MKEICYIDTKDIFTVLEIWGQMAQIPTILLRGINVFFLFFFCFFYRCFNNMMLN